MYLDISMAKVIHYKSEKKNRIFIANEVMTDGITISGIKQLLGIKSAVVFLNNERTKKSRYVLKKSDIIFVFENKSN
ncbi:MAG: hypothetical protein N3B13_04740 [Deltaproteobacteria bacterium]|nr:hypothetical protein [Deltaproteobacteria bacterium]